MRPRALDRFPVAAVHATRQGTFKEAGVRTSRRSFISATNSNPCFTIALFPCRSATHPVRAQKSRCPEEAQSRQPTKTIGRAF
eukprot:5555437-Pleurochrysis_carterae.AAC.4